MLRKALKALLNAGDEDDGDQERDEQDEAMDPTKIFGRDDILAVEREDGQKVFFMVDNIDEIEDLDHFGSLIQGAQEGGPTRLDAIRKKLLESLSSTGSAAAAKGAQKDGSSDKAQSEDEDEDDVPETHDEL